jgi:hypothetical protein
MLLLVCDRCARALNGGRVCVRLLQIKFGEDVACALACEPVLFTAKESAWVASLIDSEYKVEWYLDGLPAATPYRTTATGRKLYEPGFRLGVAEASTDPKDVRPITPPEAHLA